MKPILIALVAASTLVPLAAQADERPADAALGALSGAVVFGPVGLVAGAVVGFAAGPSIARSWRNNRYHPRRFVRARHARVAVRQRAGGAPVRPEAGSVAPQTPATGGPPAQGLE
jgi:hypothetical protein